MFIKNAADKSGRFWTCGRKNKKFYYIINNSRSRGLAYQKCYEFAMREFSRQIAEFEQL